ncbi:phosphatase PAP2 family protein [Cellulophaga baltica]|uniref:phosphatase PAP2 family protein n=1 Tax=Cellulophaga TaxID=104264 RepID=UPI001C0733A2|nr:MULTISPECIES: phosphatase PAP2 family protein [Cellulophaga]MBU2996574.1 phosphatase PAP2 family protein [Cellulophaga baltica]MDO6767968.1 phosphatase PAP2 family protein [Cellulophaga sp. 1_MG-2023]
MLDQLLQYDKSLFLFLNNLGTDNWDSFWMFVTNKFNSIPVYVVLAYLFFKTYGVKKLLLVLVFIALLITVSDQLANFFKYGVQRLRPCHDESLNTLMRLVKKSCGGKFGYFSAHASNSFAVALFFTNMLKKNYKYIGAFLFAWAFIVAYSRIYIGVHFPLDILTGTLIGLFFSWLFVKLYIFVTQKINL